MAPLTIHDFPVKVMEELEARAVASGKTVESVACDLIVKACVGPLWGEPTELQRFVDSLYGRAKPKKVVEELIAERRR